MSSVTWKPSPVCYCAECDYTGSQGLQPLETYLSQGLQNSVDHEQITQVSTKGPSKSVSQPSRYVPETNRSYSPNVSRNNRDDLSTTSVPPTQPRYPGKTQLSYNSGERESENSIENKISSVPTQDRSPSNRTYNRRQPQYPPATGLPYGGSEPRKRNDDLPPVPTQDISSSNSGPQLQHPQATQGSYSVANTKPQDFVEPLSIPSVPTEERNKSKYAPTRIQIQQPQETEIPSSTNKPRVRIEPPLKSSLPIQDPSQSNYSWTHSQPQASSNVNKPQDHVEHPTSLPTQDQGQDRGTDASKTDTRPHLMHGTPSQMDTQYVNMLLALDDIPTMYNLFAGFFSWIFLAGFILLPGTFTSLKSLDTSNQIGQRLVRVVTSIPLLVIGWLCTGIGAAGMLWLWWRWRRNYIWTLNKIFLPGAMNSLAGFLSTVANVFGVQGGGFSSSSKVTIIVTGASTGVLGILTAIYSFWLLKRVKSKHDREVGKERAGKHGEGVVDLSKRKVQV